MEMLKKIANIILIGMTMLVTYLLLNTHLSRNILLTLISLTLVVLLALLNKTLIRNQKNAPIKTKGILIGSFINLLMIVFISSLIIKIDINVLLIVKTILIYILMCFSYKFFGKVDRYSNLIINSIINIVLFTMCFVTITTLNDIVSLLLTYISLYLLIKYDKNTPFRKKNLLIFMLMGVIILIDNKINILNIALFSLLFYKIYFNGNKRKIYKYLLPVYYISAIVMTIMFKYTIVNKLMIENELVLYFSYIVFISVILLNSYRTLVRNNSKDLAINLCLLLILIYIYITNKELVCINVYTLFLSYIMSISITPNNYKKYINIYSEKYLKLNKKNPKKISVVIPNYNYEDYIIERIDSVLLQTYPIYELIILDDKSTDNSVKVIEEKIQKIKKKYPKLIVKFIVNKKNSGNVFKQWNKAFEESTGDYLWIAEADDSASNVFLENVMKSFDDESVIMSYTESLTMDENNKILMFNLRPWIDIFNTGKWDYSFKEDGKEFVKNFMCINNTIANVSSLVFKKNKKIDYSKYLKEAESYHLAGDWYFYQKLLKYGKIAYNSKSLNYHRMQGKSVTLTTKREDEYLEMCRIQSDIDKNYKLTKSMKGRIEERKTVFKNNFNFSDEELELRKIELNEIIKKKNIKDKVLLSVIMPVYNTEQYLEKCIESVLKNFPINSELIIVNDGTKDNSEKIIKKYEKKYPDIIRYFKKENGGLSHTKNYGIKKAKGKYIGFVDSDDYVKEGMYEILLKKALLEDADLVYCDIELVYKDGSRRFVSTTNNESNEELMKHLDTSLMPASWSKLAKRELFDGLDYPDKMNNEDIAVSPILFARSKKTVKVPTAFYKYYQRTGSIQNSGFSDKRFVVFKTSEICFERSKEFSTKKQEMIKGAVYTHQLLAVLIYLISEVKDNKLRLKYIEDFCQLMNKFDDYQENRYVKEYVKGLNIEDIIDCIKENKIHKIDKLLKKL